MARFGDTEGAIVQRFRAMKAKSEKIVNVVELSIPLNASGYTKDEIAAVLRAFEQDHIVSIAPGNRLRLIRPLP
jgi:hypothetical protein